MTAEIQSRPVQHFWHDQGHLFYVLIVCFGLALTVPVSLEASLDDQDPILQRGQRIYSQQCSSCHGASGQGNTDSYEDPLIGDLNVAELTELIVETMPEENPSSCTGEDATAVATYVHTEFYSSDAQFKRNRPRTRLSRRTVRQYREAIADLLGHFARRRTKITDERGLKARYYAYRSQRRGQRLAERMDAQIDFSREAGGLPYFRADDKYDNVPKINDENKTGRGFSAYWDGGIVAPKTGYYELIVETTNGFKLWLNDKRKPLIDHWVKLGDQDVHRARIFLLGGRAYRFGVEMFAFKEPDAAICIKWKPPGESESVIPARAFVPTSPSEVAVVDTPFPPDDASDGYERGISVSKEWDAATTSAAIAVSEWIANRIWKLANADPDKPDHVEKIKRFCETFVERAFVTSLNNDEKNFFVHQHFDSEQGLQDQVKRVVILALKSPRFLYPELQDRSLDFDTANRLAQTLWDSVPDRELFLAARESKLSDSDSVTKQLQRMAADPRSREKIRSFFHYWLRTHEAAEATKDDDLFPGFDEQLLKSLSRSLDMFLDDVVWSPKSDFRELFLAQHLYVNSQIAKFYGFDDLENVDQAEKSDFFRIEADPSNRAGILTHPFLMAGLAYHRESSPIHRGVFVARSLLGRRLRQPPEDVEPLTEEFNPKMTTRERVEHQTKETACMSCHSVINPLGFSLENYDAVGRFRFEDKEKPIDVSSVYETPDGESVPLDGARDLAAFLANNSAAQKSFINQVFRYYTKQPAQAYGKETINGLHAKFVENRFNIQKLLIDIAKVVVSHSPGKNNE